MKNGKPVGANAIRRTILTKVNSEDVDDVRELLNLLEDDLFSTHLNKFSGTIKWLRDNVKGLMSAKQLTENYQDAVELIDLLAHVKNIGLTKYKDELKINIKESKGSEDAIFEIEQDSIPKETLRKAKEVFKDHIK
jgi:predicted translin family RNA/ssDNA-binding protein